MALMIKDIKVENDLIGQNYVMEYKDLIYIIDRKTFNTMYDSLSTNELYRIILHKFFRNSRMFDEDYLGPDDQYYYKNSKEVISKTTSKKEQFIAEVMLGKIKKQEIQLQKDLYIKTLNESFWGSLIVQDIF